MKVRGNMVRKWIICALTLAVCMISGMVTAYAADASGNSMDIYGIVLSPTRDGDATLVESNGEFLLMDMGEAADNGKVVKVLKERKATRISLYISHYHADHYGGGGSRVAEGIEKLIDAGIYIEKLYLPDPSIAPETEDSDTTKCERLTDAVLSQTPDGAEPSVIQLKKGSKFKFGAVSAEVIGPIKGLTLKKCGNSESNYQNNHSLVTIMTCGGKKFFTAGDIQEEQENLLVKQYGSKLKADIMKLSHHGTSTANSEKIMACIRPTYSYGMNTNHTKVTSSRHQETYASKEHACEYGICYMTGEEKMSIHIGVSGGKVSLYRYSSGTNEKMTGWVSVKGGDSVNYKVDKFYLDANGKPRTGLQKIGGKYYYMGNGGCMRLGHYNAKGEYNPWSSFGKKTRYIDEKDGHLATGLATINKRLYYFDKNCYRVTTNKSVELKKINGKKYAMLKGGILYTNNGKGGFRAFPKGHRYFNAKGVMQTGWKKHNGKTYYLDDKTGYRVIGMYKVGDKTYYFGNNAALWQEVDTSAVKKFKAAAGSGNITFTWKANSKVRGYEIYLSEKKKGSYKCVQNITSGNIGSCVIGNLKSKKTYYVKIRSYTTIAGKTAKGDFGKVLTVKVK